MKPCALQYATESSLLVGPGLAILGFTFVSIGNDVLGDLNYVVPC